MGQRVYLIEAFDMLFARVERERFQNRKGKGQQERAKDQHATTYSQSVCNISNGMSVHENFCNQLGVESTQRTGDSQQATLWVLVNDAKCVFATSAHLLGCPNLLTLTPPVASPVVRSEAN